MVAQTTTCELWTSDTLPTAFVVGSIYILIQPYGSSPVCHMSEEMLISFDEVALNLREKRLVNVLDHVSYKVHSNRSPF